MPSGWWVAVLLLPAVSQAQSGDGDTDMEPRISCTSDIMTGGSSLTCKLVRNDNEDDEDNKADGIKKMTVCYTEYSEVRLEKCEDYIGDTARSRDLHHVFDLNVTVHLNGGGKISTMIDIKKIVKPRSPWVWKVTFNQESDQAVFHIQTPYHKDYLTIENQLFQLFIWTAGKEMEYQNISSSDRMSVDMKHFQANTEYHVKVRAIPVTFLQGTWSEWSETFTFFTPAEVEVQKQTDEKHEALIVCLILLVVLTSCVVFFWKNKIFTYMWPSIPHPKHTLVQICKPDKGLLLNFKPEVFSALKVYPMEKTEQQPCEETEPSIAAAAADGTQSNHPCSTQSSDCSRSATSVSTEELELSALLSRSSSDGEDSLQNTSPSPINILQLGERPHTSPPERGSGGNEAEAYVTMSSFYQIK